VHEIQQKFRYDLRVKGVLDDGKKTKNLLLSRDLVESLTGITLDAAVQLAESNPLGMDEVFYKIRDAVTGRYYTCSGSEVEGRIIAKKCEKLAFNPADLAALLNRAAGESP
jgi:replication factor A1